MRKPLLLFAHLAILRGCLGKCYYPDGTPAPGDIPCDPDAENSACCSAKSGDAFGCLANKLCRMPSGRNVRGSCTDPTWMSPECPKFCMNWGGMGWDLVSCANVTQSDTSYCCDTMPNCCNGGVGRFDVLPAHPGLWAQFDEAKTRYVVQTPLATAASSSSTTSTSSTTSSATTSTAASSGPSQQSSATDHVSAPPSSGTQLPPAQTAQAATTAGLSTAAQAGIGVGAAVGALLVAAVAYLWWRLRKSEQARLGGIDPQRQQQDAGGPSTTETYQPETYQPSAAAAPFYYPQEPRPKYELQGYSDTHELESHGEYRWADVNGAEPPTQPPYTLESPVVNTHALAR